MKRILGFILVSMMLMTMILPVSAESALDAVTRGSLLKVPSEDATLLDNLDLAIDGVAFTSSDSAVINPETGVVTRPEQTKSVVLTATAGEETKDFAFRVPGKFEAVGGEKAIPAPATVVYENDFAGTTIDTTHITKGDGDDGATQNGRLQLTGPELDVSVYPIDKQLPINGKFVIEFALNRATSSLPVKVYFFGSSGRYLEFGSAGGDVTVEDAAGPKTISAWEENGGYHLLSQGMKTTVYFDTAAGTYDLWFNNIYVQSGTTQGATDINRIHFMTGTAANGWASADYNVDDFKVYYTEKMTTFYQNSFNGESLPANVSTGAVKAEGAIVPAASFDIGLNESSTDISGTINLDFTVTRPASGGSMGLAVKDSNGKKYVNFLWWGSGNAYRLVTTYSTAAAGTGDGSATTNVGDASTTSLVVSMTIDTTTKAISIKANGVSVAAGYAMEDAAGAATLWVYEYDNAQRTALVAMNCYGNGTYMEKETHWQDSLDTMPTTRVTADGGATSDGAGAIKMGAGYFKLNIKEDGTNIAQDAVLEFNMTRYYGSNCSFDVLDAEGNKLAGFVWWSNAQGLVITPGTASSTTMAMGTYAQAAAVKIEYTHATKAVSIYVNSILQASGTAADATGGIAVLQMYNNGGGSTAEDYMRLQDIDCYSLVVGGSADNGEPETKPEVSALSLDYNAFDKKVSVLSPEAKTVTVIAAAYSGSTLVSAVPAEVTLAENGSALADTGNLTVQGADSVTIYLWDSIAGLKPLQAAAPVSGVISAY